MIQRNLEKTSKSLFSKYPVLTILGPRQSGKTVFVKNAFPEKPYENLENPQTRDFALSDPKGFLSQYPDGCILDEIQRAPELTSWIQVLVDEKHENGMFILTGSSQFNLRETVNQSLAGRTGLQTLLPFCFSESGSFGKQSLEEQLFKGFYPRLYDQGIPPVQAYGDYLETYIERDLRRVLNVKNLHQFELFLKLCAGRTGQLLNLSSLSNDIGVSLPTLREWVTVLENSFIIFLLQPFHANIRKRLIKTPKLYFYDVGLASYLCGIENSSQLQNHPLRGNLFETMVVSEILKSRFNRGLRNNLTFFRDSSGNEVDVLYQMGEEIIPVEIKSSKTVTREFFTNIQRFKDAVPNPVPKSYIAYAGEDEQYRENDLRVLQYTNISETLESFSWKVNNSK